jgi:hypothetical protein
MNVADSGFTMPGGARGFSLTNCHRIGWSGSHENQSRLPSLPRAF